MPLNCAALPLELLENELFGHVSGAYTGAGPAQKGLIEQAEGGILFLDEIDCLVLLGQAKLLRFLQECEVRPLGAASVRRANVRIISACNRDLPAAVRAGTFREDLYYRLSVLTLNLPPLRQMRDDISLLATELLKRHETSSNPGVTFLPAALRKLNDYDWPGNVRQLENIIRRSLALSNKSMIDASDLDIPVVEASSFKEQKARAIAEFERHYLREALARHNGNITHAAKEAGKNRRAFFALLSKYHLNSQSSARIQ